MKWMPPDKIVLEVSLAAESSARHCTSTAVLRIPLFLSSFIRSLSQYFRRRCLGDIPLSQLRVRCVLEQLSPDIVGTSAFDVFPDQDAPFSPQVSMSMVYLVGIIRSTQDLAFNNSTMLSRSLLNGEDVLMAIWQPTLGMTSEESCVFPARHLLEVPVSHCQGTFRRFIAAGESTEKPIRSMFLQFMTGKYLCRVFSCPFECKIRSFLSSLPCR